MTDESSRAVSRRRVLRILGASGVAAMGTAGVAAAQSGTDYTSRMVISEAEEFTDSYTGLFVYVEERSTSDLEAEEVADCEFENWSPEGLDAFNGRLVDRIEDDHKDIPAQIYTAADSGIEEGALYVINRAFPCPGGYVGLETEAIRTEGLDQNGSDLEVTGTKTTDGDGPGFGVAGAVAGIGGLAGLLRYLRSDGEE